VSVIGYSGDRSMRVMVQGWPGNKLEPLSEK
jgi:hypothetical protein